MLCVASIRKSLDQLGTGFGLEVQSCSWISRPPEAVLLVDHSLSVSFSILNLFLYLPSLLLLLRFLLSFSRTTCTPSRLLFTRKSTDVAVVAVAAAAVTSEALELFS